MTRSLHFPAAAILLLLIDTPTSAGAQAIAYGEPPPIRGRPAALVDQYHVRLTSSWPQLPGTTGCENGGAETVVGTLGRTGSGEYAGTLTRTTHLLFCGAHGPEADACTLVLEGAGDVVMRGTVVQEERSANGRALRVSWTPAAEHHVQVTGGCSDDFKQKAQLMYLTARHGAEFPLPEAGATRSERLEDYAWTVEVR